MADLLRGPDRRADGNNAVALPLRPLDPVARKLQAILDNPSAAFYQGVRHGRRAVRAVTIDWPAHLQRWREDKP